MNSWKEYFMELLNEQNNCEKMIVKLMKQLKEKDY